MATIDLRTPEARREFGLSDETVSAPSHQAKNHGTHRSRAETRALVIDVLRHAVKPMTRLQIARAIQRAKSPHLVALILELVESGDVVETASVQNNGAIQFEYTWGG